MKTISRWLLSGMIPLLFLMGCGGGGSGGGGGGDSDATPSPSTVINPTTAYQVTGRVVDGPIANATLSLVTATGGLPVTRSDGSPVEGTTDENGYYRLDWTSSSSLNGNLFIVTSEGGTDTGSNGTLGDSDDLPGLPLSSVIQLTSEPNYSTQIISPITTMVSAKVENGVALAEAEIEVASQVGLSVSQLYQDPTQYSDTAQVAQSLATLVRLLDTLQDEDPTNSRVHRNSNGLAILKMLADSNKLLIQRSSASSDTEEESLVLQPENIVASLKDQIVDPVLLAKTEAMVESSVDSITLLAQQTATQTNSDTTDSQAVAAVETGLKSLLESANMLRETEVNDVEQEQGNLYVIAHVMNTAAQKSMTDVIQAEASQAQADPVSEAELQTMLEVIQPLLEQEDSLLANAAKAAQQDTIDDDAVTNLQLEALSETIVDITRSDTNGSDGDVDVAEAQEVVEVTSQLIETVINESFVQDVDNQLESQNNDSLTDNRDAVLEASAVTASKNVLSLVQTLSQDPALFEDLKQEAKTSSGSIVKNTIEISKAAVNQLIDAVAEESDESSQIIRNQTAVSQLTEQANVTAALQSQGNNPQLFTQNLNSDTLSQAQATIQQNLSDTRNEIVASNISTPSGNTNPSPVVPIQVSNANNEEETNNDNTPPPPPPVVAAASTTTTVPTSTTAPTTSTTAPTTSTTILVTTTTTTTQAPPPPPPPPPSGGGGGGGGGGSSAPPPPPPPSPPTVSNNAPVANAGADQEVLLNMRVALNGSGSTDADGDSLSYNWSVVSQPNGSSVSFTLANSMIASFQPEVLGDYQIRLQVNDGTTTSQDTMKVSAIIDTVAPTVTSENFLGEGLGFTSATSSNFWISALDNIAPTGYFVSESSTTPQESDANWVSFANSASTYEVEIDWAFSAGLGEKNVYVWFKDQSGNISDPVSDRILVLQEADYHMTFSDTDTDAQQIAGVVQIQVPTSNPTLSVASYDLVWADGFGSPLANQAVIANLSSAPWSYTFSSNTAVPAGASRLVALAKNGSGDPIAAYSIRAEPLSLPIAAQIDGGSGHTCAVLNTGSVNCWGFNHSGQLGRGSTGGPALTAYAVEGISNAVQVVTGESHSCALLQTGTVACWGDNTFGQLGIGFSAPQPRPVSVPNLADVVYIDAGRYNTCATTEQGIGWCWGDNSEGQLGDRTFSSQNFPTRIPLLTNIKKVVSGGSHSCALLQDGTIRCWGKGTVGQMGNGIKTQTIVTPSFVQNINSATDISSTGGNVCALLQNGTIHCWGGGTRGQLGNGSTQNSAVPVQVTGISNAVEVQLGMSHACARLQDQTLRCWGEGHHGQLGNGTTPLAQATPVTVTGISNALKLGAGHAHSCSILATNTIQCWGYNWSGQLGIGTTQLQNTPTSWVNSPPNLTAPADQTVAINVPKEFTLYAQDNHQSLFGYQWTLSSEPVGTATALESTTSNKLTFTPTKTGTYVFDVSLTDGLLSTSSSFTLTAVSDETGPTITNTNFLDNGNTVTIASSVTATIVGTDNVGVAGYYLSANATTPSVSDSGWVDIATTVGPSVTTRASFVLSDGVGEKTAYLWLKDAIGNISNRVQDTIIRMNEPTHQIGFVNTDSDAGEISGTLSITKATDESQLTHYEVYWGSDFNTPLSEQPAIVTLAKTGSDLSHVFSANTTIPSGANYLLVYTKDASGQLLSVQTILIDLPQLDTLNKIALGQFHSCFVLNDGGVKCWGEGSYGRLGDASANSRAYPVRVHNLTSAQQVSAGHEHTCAVLTDGTVQCWGRGTHGRLGNNNFVDAWSPVNVSGISNAIQVVSGSAHSCALLQDGTAQCWGRNINGQIGNGTSTTAHTPVPVSNLSNAVQLTAGFEHTCALLNDGTIQCWGEGAYGALGNNNTSDQTTPAPVQGISNASSITAGTYHTCATLKDSTMRCWGYNSSNGLGDGTSLQRNVPVVVNNINGVRLASASGFTTCAILLSGSIKCWGDGYYGQLGNGANVNSALPVDVLNLTNVQEVAGYYIHYCALKPDQSVSCWGRGREGQIGNGNTVDVNVPTAISNQAPTADAGEDATVALNAQHSLEGSGTDLNGDPLTFQWQVTTQPSGSSPSFGNANTNNTTFLPDTAGAYVLTLTANDGQTSGSDTVTVNAIVDSEAPQIASTSTFFGALEFTLSSSLTATLTGTDNLKVAGVLTTETATIPTANDARWVAIATTLNPITVKTDHVFSSGLGTKTVYFWLKDASGNVSSSITDTIRRMETPSHTVSFTDADTDTGEIAGTLTIGKATDESSFTHYDIYWGSGLATPLAGQPIIASLAKTGSDLSYEFSANTVVPSGATQILVFTRDGSGTLRSVNGVLLIEQTTSVGQISSGGIHSCWLLTTGGVKCWGNGSNGRLGHSNGNHEVNPKTIENLSNVVQIDAGNEHTCALLQDQTVRCWGTGKNGRLGNGASYHSVIPVAVSGLSNVTQISAGWWNSCVVLSDRTVQCWGQSYLGSLGTGSTDPYSAIPAVVPGLTNVIKVSVGRSHICALRDDGTVYCWGLNLSGDPAPGQKQISQPTPVDIGVANAVDVSSGNEHSCAVTSSGSVYCWGEGMHGVLGNGSGQDSASPLLIPGISTAVRVASGATTTCALLASQQVKCWGNGTYGGLGNGTNELSYVPVTVSGLSNVRDLSAGVLHYCALLSDYSARCWGYNYRSNLGDGTKTNSNVPVAVINQAPSLSYIGSFTIAVGAPVPLITTANDADGDLLNYQWSVLSKPNGSTANFSSETAAAPTLTVDQTGTYQVSVTVSDGVASANQTITLNAIVDTVAPIQNTGANFINNGAASTQIGDVTLAIGASDNTMPSAYFASEQSDTPAAGAVGWIATSGTSLNNFNVTFSLSSTTGTKTVNVWFKDPAGNVSAPASDSIFRQ